MKTFSMPLTALLLTHSFTLLYIHVSCKNIGPVDLFKTFLLVKLQIVGTVYSGLGHGRSFYGFIFVIVAGLKYCQASHTVKNGSTLQYVYNLHTTYTS